MQTIRQAIRWAIDQGVDIISISWTTKKENKALEDAIMAAVKPTDEKQCPTLVFCSVADEGVYSGKVYPLQIDPENTLSVAATDQYGHLTPASLRAGNKDVIQVPGEAVATGGPSYTFRDFDADVDVDEGKKIGDETVSGSSVATALAAGIASLALLMIKVYAKPTSRNWHAFHKRNGILNVFDKMNFRNGGIVLEKLFPDEITHKELTKLWNINPNSKRHEAGENGET